MREEREVFSYRRVHQLDHRGSAAFAIGTRSRSPAGFVQEMETGAPHLHTVSCPALRWTLILFGWINVGLGTLGLFLPVMPTTVFVLLALWAFAKSSPRFHRWLWTHPRFGNTIRAWQTQGVIPIQLRIGG